MLPGSCRGYQYVGSVRPHTCVSYRVIQWFGVDFSCGLRDTTSRQPVDLVPSRTALHVFMKFCWLRQIAKWSEMYWTCTRAHMGNGQNCMFWGFARQMSSVNFSCSKLFLEKTLYLMNQRTSWNFLRFFLTIFYLLTKKYMYSDWPYCKISNNFGVKAVDIITACLLLCLHRACTLCACSYCVTPDLLHSGETASV